MKQQIVVRNYFWIVDYYLDVINTSVRKEYNTRDVRLRFANSQLILETISTWEERK